jgi:hypothetical protein
MKIIRKTTGTREKAGVPAGIMVTCTKGILRLTTALIDALSLTTASKLVMVLGEEEDDNGEAVKAIYMSVEPKGSEEGATLGAVGSLLQFSDSATYQHLEGNEKVNRLFTVDVEAGEEVEGTTYYKLVFASETAKSPRKSSAEGGDEEDDEEGSED